MKEIICDFELNIHKAIDEMIPEVDILGCFFHLAKAFKEKVDKKNMKSEYDNNSEFRKFVKQCIALSSLPLVDIEPGLQWLKNNSRFKEDNIEKFLEFIFLIILKNIGLMGVLLHIYGVHGREQMIILIITRRVLIQK